MFNSYKLLYSNVSKTKTGPLGPECSAPTILLIDENELLVHDVLEILTLTNVREQIIDCLEVVTPINNLSFVLVRGNAVPKTGVVCCCHNLTV